MDFFTSNDLNGNYSVYNSVYNFTQNSCAFLCFFRYVKPSAMRKVENLAFLRNNSPTSALKAGDILDVEKGKPKHLEPGVMMPKL